MKSLNKLILGFFAISAIISGCATSDSRPATSTSSPTYYGVVESIDRTTATTNDGIAGTGIGLGTVVGGVLGGVAGHQVGSGTGNTAATVAGAVGGAVIGREYDKQNQAVDAFRIRVRLDNGGMQTVTQNSISDLRVGDRVRIQQNTVYRN
ncbi:MAG: glycine zipper 2TM domain-containing protein [Burkholderiales bacterium]